MHETHDSKGEGVGAPVIVGDSPALRDALVVARQVAPTTIPVLLVGETGTGKELFAQLIHRESGRPGRLVAIDCGTVPDDLAESQLFGHRRGAFTGADEQTDGLMIEANHGTLFMDEVASLSPRGQAKLLRALETGSVRRLGDAFGRSVAFRLITTATHSLGTLVREGAFRQDLMQRMAGVVIALPSLRDRGDDVLLLARHFAAEEGISFDRKALAFLCNLSWPGNVRELKRTVARCALFTNAGTVGAPLVKLAIAMGPSRLWGGEEGGVGTARDFGDLRRLCERFKGNMADMARERRVPRSTLYRQLRDAGLRPKDFREAVGD